MYECGECGLPNADYRCDNCGIAVCAACADNHCPTGIYPLEDEET